VVMVSRSSVFCGDLPMETNSLVQSALPAERLLGSMRAGLRYTRFELACGQSDSRFSTNMLRKRNLGTVGSSG